MYLLKNLHFIFDKADKTAFCKINNIKYRTFQDVYLGITKDPRISLLIQISKALNITLDSLVLNDLEELSKEEIK